MSLSLLQFLMIQHEAVALVVETVAPCISHMQCHCTLLCIVSNDHGCQFSQANVSSDGPFQAFFFALTEFTASCSSMEGFPFPAMLSIDQD